VRIYLYFGSYSNTMSLLTPIFLCIISLVTTVNCQGGGGGGAGGGVGLGLFVLAIFCWPIYCCWRCFAGKPRRSNMRFVGNTLINNEGTQLMNAKLFESGLWESHYHQYDKWNGPHQFQLSFDGLQSTVTGSGSDNIGTFSINGVYSVSTGRMGLTKIYQLGTGNPLENLGHSVTIQVEWNRYNNQFEGKWYVRTSKFAGSGEFKLQYARQQQSFSSVYDKV
jgi:hypothetical protein